MTRALSVLIAVIALTGLPVLAGPGPKPKLPAPQDLTCVVEGDAVVVDWDLVEGAANYQVESVAFSPEGEVLEESEFVSGPPVLVALDDATSLTVHVRALPAPKRPGQKAQAGGPKGRWSEPCVVALP